MKQTIALLTLACISSSALAEQWLAPRMPWGVPDLQGIWTSATITTLEREDEFEHLVLNEQEALLAEKGMEAFADAIDDLEEGDLEVGGDVGGYNSFWIDPGTRTLRVKGEARSSIIVDPADGQIPYTFMARMRSYWEMYKTMSRQNNPEERPQGERCTVGFGSTGGPPMLPVLYNNNYQFAQSPNTVLVLVEMNHNVRTIRVGGERLPKPIRPWLGDSIGRWEGDTLVVETTQFHPQQSLRLAIKHQLMMSPDSVVTERFTRISNNEMLYQFTVSDDQLYTQDWRGELTLWRSEGPIYEYACHEGNYSLTNILEGARQKERE